MVVLQLNTGEELEINADIPISLNFSIADIRDPSKRNSSFSKTVMLPGTDNNNNILTHIYNVNKEGGFDPNIKQTISVLQDGITVLDGFMQLLEIVTEDKHIIYKVALFGDNGEFMSNLEGLLLSDINFSDLDHILNLTNIRASWGTIFGAGYMYPLVDNGFTDGITWGINSFTPAIYAREYIDRIFSNAGYTFTSVFFDSDYFKKLIIPYSGALSKLSEAAQKDKYLKVSRTSTYSVPQTGLFPNRVIYNFRLSDPAGVATTLAYVVQNTGAYKVVVDLRNVSAENSIVGGVAVERDGVAQYIILEYFDINGVVSNQNILLDSSNYPTIELLPGDKIYTSISYKSNDILPTNISIGADSTMEVTSINTTLQDGDQVNMNLVAPIMKQIDFFMNLVKMHNLYVSPDPDNKKNLIIEPKEDYYNETTIDWTSKLDRSQGLKIKPLGELGGRKYVFKYKDGKDYYNKIYQAKYEESSGQRTVYSTNEFLKKEVKTEITFSPSIIFGDRWEGPNPFRYPYYSDDDVYHNAVPTNYSTNPKILLYNGLAIAPAWYTESGGVKTIAAILFGAYRYPFCSHLDDTTNPTIDISFGIPKELQTAYTDYTNNNLYNKYYSKFIEEILDPDSKVITGMFLLNSADINSLDFAKQYLVDNYLLRLNSIKNYDPSNPSSLCVVEFIKIKAAAPFSASTTSSFGGIKKEI